MAKKDEAKVAEEVKGTEQSTDVAVKAQDQALVNAPEAPLGFEDEEQGDMIIPRVKVIQTLSPERKDKTCDEGDIINSLTKDKLNGKVFVPVFKFNNNIYWKDRSDGGGMLCIARDGKIGESAEATGILCSMCKKNEFDNSKTGKESHPKCTKYINFFGFIAGERIPLILSFAKTNYNEGKKLYSLAKVTMQNMWNHGYTLTEKLVKKSDNEWYIITVAAAGPVSAEDKAFGMQLYQNFRNINIKFDMDNNTDESGMTDEQANSTEF
jgi:hypothetical protein